MHISEKEGDGIKKMLTTYKDPNPQNKESKTIRGAKPQKGWAGQTFTGRESTQWQKAPALERLDPTLNYTNTLKNGFGALKILKDEACERMSFP